MLLDVATAEKHTQEHAGDVGVDDGGTFTKREAANRSCRVCANAFERSQRFFIRRELSAESLHGFARDRLQPLGPNVIAKRVPRVGHIFRRCIGERCKGRIFLEPLLVFRQDAVDLRLLQHDLGDEDVIRVVGVAPGQITPIFAIPGQKPAAKALAYLRRWQGMRHERSLAIIAEVKIYTKTGDSGETSLFDGTRVPKTHERVVAYGEVDELQAVLGVCAATTGDQQMVEMIVSLQRDLFALGARLADPSHRIAARVTKVVITEETVVRLEGWIDRLEAELPPLRHFILSGGSPAGASLHLARTVCRRAERAVLSLGVNGDEPIVLVYLNRLSDLLFVMARASNRRASAAETEW